MRIGSSWREVLVTVSKSSKLIIFHCHARIFLNLQEKLMKNLQTFGCQSWPTFKLLPLSLTLYQTHMAAFEGRKGLNWIAVLFPCKEHQGTLVFKKMDNCGFCHFVWYDGVCSVGRRQYPVHLPFEVKKMVRKRIHLYGVHSPMQETKWYKCNKLIFMVLGGRILLTHLLC